jgi:hypothetical protein
VDVFSQALCAMIPDSTYAADDAKCSSSYHVADVRSGDREFIPDGRDYFRFLEEYVTPPAA